MRRCPRSLGIVAWSATPLSRQGGVTISPGPVSIDAGDSGERDGTGVRLPHRGYDVDQPEPTKGYLYPSRVEVISYPWPVPGIESRHLVPNAEIRAAERRDGPRRYCLLPRLLSRRQRGRRGTLRFRAGCSWKSRRWPTRRCSTIAHPVSVQSDFGCGEGCVTVAKDAGPLGPGVPPAGGCR